MWNTKDDLKLCGAITMWPKGQIVIPKEVRDSMWLEQWDWLALFLKGNKIMGLMRNDDLGEVSSFIERQRKSIIN